MKRFVLLSLCVATPAFAQGDPTTTTEMPAGSASVGTPSGSASADASAGMTLGWSPELLAAAQTLPASAIGLEATLVLYRHSTPATPPATGDTVSTIEAMSLGGAYGATDKLTVGGTYFFSLHDPGGTWPTGDRWKGALDLYGAYNVIHEAKMSLTAGADFSIDVGNTKARVLGLGASFKYMFAPKLAFFTGNPIPIGPAGDQLTIGLASKSPIALHVPAGIALQATPQIFGYLAMNLMDINIANGKTGFIFADQIGMSIGALFRATPDIDVGVMIYDDFKNAGDAYNIGFTGRYYIHK